ncbi:MAG: DUF892 family protein [Bradyrhizobium sp.]|nr:DUF892 family protein [Pseudomonadota bacterium]MDE2467508.1 DUF892 family protein [Bradyrhizobium sp.]
MRRGRSQRPPSKHSEQLKIAARQAGCCKRKFMSYSNGDPAPLNRDLQLIASDRDERPAGKVFEEIEETPPAARPATPSWASSRRHRIIKEFKATPALDAGLLAATQPAEHPEIARYSTLDETLTPG